MFQCVLALSAERLVWIVDLSKQIGDVLARFCFGSPTSAAVCTYLYFTLLNALACGVQMGSWVTVSVWHIHAAGAVSPADCRLWPRECHCGKKKQKLTNKWHSTRLKGPCSWSSSNLIVIIQHCVQWATKSWEGTRTVHIQGNDQEAHVRTTAESLTETRTTSWWHLDISPTTVQTKTSKPKQQQFWKSKRIRNETKNLSSWGLNSSPDEQHGVHLRESVARGESAA